MLRLKLRHEHPDRVTVLHRRAARWYARNGRLTDAVRHAAAAGDWPLAAAMVVDDLAISQLLAPRDGPSLAGQFAEMPSNHHWAEPQPYLICAAMALTAGRARHRPPRWMPPTTSSSICPPITSPSVGWPRR